MLLLWDCLKNLMDSFTIFWLSRTDRFRVPQMWGQYQIFLDKYSPLLGSVQWSEIPKWIGSSNIDFISHLQYDKLWGLPRRVFTLLFFCQVVPLLLRHQVEVQGLWQAHVKGLGGQEGVWWEPADSISNDCDWVIYFLLNATVCNKIARKGNFFT